jgi:hypothetical protein
MNFDEHEIIAAAMIGFDMIEGPNLKWSRQFQDCGFNFNVESFLMNFYLSFRGGNDGMKPLAILYDGFYIVAFPRGLELCCLFMRPDNLIPKLQRLSEIANELVNQMDEKENSNEGAESNTQTSQDYEEIKRIVVNLLHGQQMSTPELRRYFKLSNSEIWKIVSELEESAKITRTQKVGRIQYWSGVAA